MARKATPTVLITAALAVTGWIVGPLLFAGQAETIRAIFAGPSVLVMGMRENNEKENNMAEAARPNLPAQSIETSIGA